MTDNIITRDEAIDRMKAGLTCETRFDHGGAEWTPLVWADFDYTNVMFRKPPEPQRVGRQFTITWRDGAYRVSIPNYEGGEVREVLPGDELLRPKTEAAWRRFYAETFGYRGDQSTFIEFVRALGLIGEGS